MSIYRIVPTDELYHHGVKGMKWGVRKDRDKVTRGDLRKAARKVGRADRARRDAATYVSESVTSRQADINSKLYSKRNKEYESARKDFDALKTKRQEQKEARKSERQEQKKAKAENKKESSSVKKGSLAVTAVVATAAAAGITIAEIRSGGALFGTATLYDSAGNAIRRVRQ